MTDLLVYFKAFIMEISPDLKFLIDLIDTKLVRIEFDLGQSTDMAVVSL
jgi:hypothetical protein